MAQKYAFYGTKTTVQVDNQPDGIDKLEAKLKTHQVSFVVVEATGSLEMPIVAALLTDGMPTAIANLRQVRDFA